MKTSALVMGILGGVFGVLFGLLALGLGGIGNDSTVVALGISAFICSIVSIVGGALTGSRPGRAASLMLVAGVGILVSISLAGVIPGTFMLLGAVFAFVEHRRQPRGDMSPHPRVADAASQQTPTAPAPRVEAPVAVSTQIPQRPRHIDLTLPPLPPRPGAAVGESRPDAAPPPPGEQTNSAIPARDNPPPLDHVDPTLPAGFG